jgi:hypothetical protein
MADRRLLTKNVRRVFTISGAVKHGRAPGCQASSHSALRRSCRWTYGDYIFAGSRLAPLGGFPPDRARSRIRTRRGFAALSRRGRGAGCVAHAIATRGLQSRITLIGRIDDSQLVDICAPRAVFPVA